MWAELAQQPLGLQHPERGAEQERLDAHVSQTGHGRQGIIGVDRREHEVPGQGRAKADLGGFAVADLADHDDVGILPQKGPQCRGEGQPDLGLDHDLVHALEFVLDRVFDRADVDRGLVQQVEAGVERRRLAAAGRPGHQHQAVRSVDRLDQVVRLPLVES